MLRGLDWVLQNAALPAIAVTTISSDNKSPALTAAIDALLAKGITVIAAAGYFGQGGSQLNASSSALPWRHT